VLDTVLAGRYRILSPLGAGGMGEVFLAEDTRLERRVALKLLPASAEVDRVAEERLRREALAAAALDHPFICKVHEIAEANGRLFIVMEYVEGETLSAVARGTRLPMRQVIDIARELAEALDAAHKRNIVHRDLKPANVMITPQGHVKVMDFGLAKQLVVAATGSRGGTPPPSDAARAAADASTRLTDPGTRLGTPAYMSPEQVLGSPLDPRSDIFSLGVILHELATGSHPFLRDTPGDTMAAILRDPPGAGSRDAAIAGGLGPVIARMLSKACVERPQRMGEVLADLEAVRERAWSTSGSGGSPLAQPAERTPFVGRDSETAELERALDRMLTGQGGLVLVGGEPGVGKTRLVRELMVKARERGCICASGHCYEMEGAPPFVPFVELTEQLVRSFPQPARAAMGEFAAEIAAMVPSLRRTYADIPPLPDVPADQQRRLIFNAYHEYVRRGAQKSPGVYLLDDLHWADEPTLQLLQYAAPHLASMRVLVVGTYRDVELDVKRPFAKTLESLLRQRLATRIALRRLTEAAVQELLKAMSGSTPPSGVAKAVFRETEGNPFFVEEVYQHLSEEGKLFDAAGKWKADLRVDTIEVPEGVRLVIGRRLDRLGEQARKVLTAGAVIGRSFPLDLLQATVELPEDDVLDAVEEAERAQLVSGDASQRTPRYGFVHELIRTTLVNGLSLPRRQRLHLRIADALERLRAGSLDSHASVLAHHLYQAGAAADADRTARALMLAGRRALAAGAFEEALETFDNLLGLELSDDHPLLADVWEQRGGALSALGRPDESFAAFERALDLFIASRQDAGIEATALGLVSVRGWQGRPGQATPVLRRALAALSDGAEIERANLLGWLASTQLTPAHLEESGRHFSEALAIANRLGDSTALYRALNVQSQFLRLSCDFEGSVASAQRSLALTPPGALWDRANLLSGLVVAHYYRGRLDQCDELFPQVVDLAQRAGHGGALFIQRWMQHWIVAAQSGNIRALLDETLQLRALPYFTYLPMIAAAQCRLYLGEVESALADLGAVIAEIGADNWFLGIGEGNLFAATALAGQHDRARALIPAVVPRLAVAGRLNIHGGFFALEALITGLALLGEREQRGALYPLTLEHIRSGQVVSGVVVGPTNPQLAAALAADAAGLVEKSREHFETALRQAREVPIRILEPTVLYWYGRALSSSSETAEHARGRAMVESALTGFREREMVLHADQAERFLRQRQT